MTVEDRESYTKQGLEHVQNPNVYSKLDGDPTGAIVEEINEAVRLFYDSGLFDKHTFDFLTQDPKKVRTQQLYFLTKIHKDPVAYRPIVSGSSGPTEAISKFIDYVLKPIVERQTSYVPDSGSFIRHMETRCFPRKAKLVTIDVSSLYTNIPQEEGISSCLRAIFLHYQNPFLVSICRVFLHHILKNNVFCFDGIMYRQNHGTAMGTAMAPNFSNIFMAQLEEGFLEDEPIKPLMWVRYIDDVFMVWPGTDPQLEGFLHRLNDRHPTIKFTHKTDDLGIEFLDIFLYKGRRFHKPPGLIIEGPFIRANTVCVCMCICICMYVCMHVCVYVMPCIY